MIKESYDEEVDDDETMSENTLKDFEKIRKKSSKSHSSGREGSSTSRKGRNNITIYLHFKVDKSCSVYYCLVFANIL